MGYFRPTIIDILTYMGTFGLFFTCFLLFIRWIPMVAVSEVKGTMPGADPHWGHREAPATDDTEARDASLAPAE